MDLRQLRHFVAVAEELHFGRAAIRLNMAQPPLSQSIKRFETELGVRLLERSRRGVSLTAAGQVCLAEAKRTLMQANLTEIVTKRTAAGEGGRLSISFIGPAMNRTLPLILSGFRQTRPDVEIQLIEMSSPDQISAILAGTLDVGVVRPTEDLPECGDRFTIERCRLVAAVAAGSHLAKKSSIRLSDLADEPMIKSPDTPHTTRVMAAYRAAGFVPRIGQVAAQTSTKLSLVAAGFGWALVPATAQMNTHTNVAFVPISDMPANLDWELAIVSRSQSATPTSQAFIDYAKAFVGKNSVDVELPRKRR